MSSSFHRTAEWIAFARRMRPIIEATLPAPCVNRCRRGGVVYPEQRFDVAHLLDAHLYPDLRLDPGNVGPAHPGCNRSDGGRAGAAITNRRRARAKTGEKWMTW